MMLVFDVSRRRVRGRVPLFARIYPPGATFGSVQRHNRLS
jgi:hypothetical protein